MFKLESVYTPPTKPYHQVLLLCAPPAHVVLMATTSNCWFSESLLNHALVLHHHFPKDKVDPNGEKSSNNPHLPKKRLTNETKIRHK